MTPITRSPDTDTRRASAARVPDSPRPTPGAAEHERTAEWYEPVWATTVARAKITVTVVAILARVVLGGAVPPAVTIPLTVVVLTGLFVAGMFLWMERLTRPDRRARRTS